MQIKKFLKVAIVVAKLNFLFQCTQRFRINHKTLKLFRVPILAPGILYVDGPVQV